MTSTNKIVQNALNCAAAKNNARACNAKFEAGDSVMVLKTKKLGTVEGRNPGGLYMVSFDNTPTTIGFDESELRLANARACNSTNPVVRKALNSVATNAKDANGKEIKVGSLVRPKTMRPGTEEVVKSIEGDKVWYTSTYGNVWEYAKNLIVANARACNTKWVVLYRDGGKEKIDAPSHAEAKKIADDKSKKSGRGYISVIVDDGVDYGINAATNATEWEKVYQIKGLPVKLVWRGEPFNDLKATVEGGNRTYVLVARIIASNPVSQTEAEKLCAAKWRQIKATANAVKTTNAVVAKALNAEDAQGHEHGEDGKFISKGGGSSDGGYEDPKTKRMKERLAKMREKNEALRKDIEARKAGLVQKKADIEKMRAEVMKANVDKWKAMHKSKNAVVQKALDAVAKNAWMPIGSTSVSSAKDSDGRPIKVGDIVTKTRGSWTEDEVVAVFKDANGKVGITLKGSPRLVRDPATEIVKNKDAACNSVYETETELERALYAKLGKDVDVGIQGSAVSISLASKDDIDKALAVVKGKLGAVASYKFVDGALPYLAVTLKTPVANSEAAGKPVAKNADSDWIEKFEVGGVYHGPYMNKDWLAKVLSRTDSSIRVAIKSRRDKTWHGKDEQVTLRIDKRLAESDGIEVAKGSGWEFWANDYE